MATNQPTKEDTVLYDDDFTDNDSAKLLELLARYATAYGKDCPDGFTVVDLADDLASSLVGAYAPASRPEEWRDQVEQGLTGRIK